MFMITRNNVSVLGAALLLLALAISTTLSARSGAATTVSASQGSLISSVPVMQAEADARTGDALLRSGWGAAQPAVFARIATAFDSEAMSGADLMGVECRSSICKIRFQADSDINVETLLPTQLANAFHSIVTIHSVGAANIVYMDIPSSL